MLIRVKNKTNNQIAVPLPVGGQLNPLAQGSWVEVSPIDMEKAIDFHAAVKKNVISYEVKENPTIPDNLESASQAMASFLGLALTIGGEGALAEVSDAKAFATLTGLGTVVEAHTVGADGNNITVALVGDSALGVGVTIVVAANAVTIHYEANVSTVANVETAITALAGADDVIDVKTAAVDGTVVLTAATATATPIALTGGTSAFTDLNEIRVAGQVVNGMGQAVAGIKNVLINIKGATAGQGLATLITGNGTAKHGDGSISLWLQTTATGAFLVKVADTQVESILFEAKVDGGVEKLATLTFAAEA